MSITTTSLPTTPTSPPRPGRLRGLSYLRNYTTQHLLSRDSNPSSGSLRPGLGSRATSYPASSSSNRGSQPSSPYLPAFTSPSSPSPNHTTSPTAQRPTIDGITQDSVASTSGWLPTVGGQSGVSRIGIQPQSTATGSSSALLSSNGTADLGSPMARTRSATTDGATDMPIGEVGNEGGQANMASNAGNSGTPSQLPSIRFIAHQDPRAQRPSLVFSPMARILPTGKETIKVGRYSERENHATQPANVPSAAPVGFKSKVVSRRHCEFWCQGGKWYIKDVKSSSGTFLNHIRLSSPNTESRPFPLNDGDIVQLGIDFKGGEEMIFRCVKIRVELNKGWQNSPTSFNVASHKRLREMMANQSKAGGTSQDCSICLGAIQPCQSLFVAPCSHTWHYKCIRTIINGPHWPHFLCPNCRMVADLEADLDDLSMEGEWEEYKPTEVSENAVPASAPPTGTTRGQRKSSTAVSQDDDDNDESIIAAVLSSNPPVLDMDSEEPSEDLDVGIDEVVDDLDHLNIIESNSDSGAPEQVSSNSTSSPMNIVRKESTGGAASHAITTSSRSMSGRSRTPSPMAVDGPMTPRNDVGPFVFDGTGGRVATLRYASNPAMNIDAATSTSNPSPDAITES